MPRQAKDFSLADLDSNQAYTVGENPQAQAKEALSHFIDGQPAIHLDIDAVDLIKLEKEAKNPQKTSANKKSGKYENLKAYKQLHQVFSIKRKIPIREKQTFYDLMSVMVEAGIPILKALKVYTSQTTHRYFKKVCRALVHQLEKGEKFSASLAEYPRIFGESELGIIAAAEATGRMVEALRRLSSEIEKAAALKSKVFGALIYPATVLVFVIITVVIMLKFVIPQISQLFTQSNLELPGVTRLVINSSQFVTDHGWALLIYTALFFGLNYLLYRFKKTRYYYHYAILKLPVLGEFQKEYAQAAFTRSLANLIASGVGIIQSLEISAKSVGNLVYQNKIRLLAKDVTNGISMGDSLANSPYFTNMLVNMITVGEQTAQIDSIAARLANYFTEKIYGGADTFTKLLQPIIIAIVGAIVGVIVLAIMLPLSDLISNVGAL